MKTLITALILGTGSLMYAQTPAPKPAAPATKEITVKSSTTEDALISIYADLDSNRKKQTDALNAARFELDKENKPLQAKIDPIQKQMTENNQKVGQKYQDTVTPFVTAVQKDAIQIEAIQNLVKKEQGLPADATFDVNTGKWVVPVLAEVKK